MSPVEAYLNELSAIRASGAAVKETSYYVPLANLFNQIGKTLKPKVHAILQLQNQGAGLPDGGFFTSDQLRNVDPDKPLLGQQPARGVIEVKGTADELAEVVETQQVRNYVLKYGQLLLTNYRDFLLLKRGKGAKPVALESFSLAESE